MSRGIVCVLLQSFASLDFGRMNVTVRSFLNLSACFDNETSSTQWARLLTLVEAPSSESESHIFSVVEPCLGIICICAPTVYPLIRGVFQDHALSRQSKSTQKAMASDQTKSGDYVELNEGRLLA